MTTFQYYADILSHMPVNKNKSKVAPHKAILLLTIIDMIENGEILSPFIPINDSLTENFKRVWRAKVPSNSGYKPKIAYPFFHLSSSPFWELVKTPSYHGQIEYSTIKALKRDYSGAIIDVGLFRIMKDPTNREKIKKILKSEYLDAGQTSKSLISLISIITLICTVA